MAVSGPPSMICRRRSPHAPPGSSSSSTRTGCNAWRISSAAATGSCLRTTASRRCCRRPPRSSTTRSVPPAALRSTSAGRGFSSRPACRASCRMLEEQIIPRLLARGGAPTAIHLKRFHSYGLGESHVDQLLTGVEDLVPDGSVKLGFRTHYPQIETKLTVCGADMDEIYRKLAPVEAEVRRRLGNFIIAEDGQTLERVVLDALAARGGSLAVVETFTAGQIAARLAHLPGGEKVFRRGLVARDPAEIAAALGLDGALISGEMSREAAERVAQALREETGATHALAVLIEVDDGPDRIDFGGSIHLAIAGPERVESRRSRIYGGRD